MIVAASLAAAVLPMIIYLLLIWYFDLYDREPFKVVLLNYFWGAFGAIIFAVFGALLLTYVISGMTENQEQLDYIGTIAIAPIVEEITKGLFLFLTASRLRFDNITDGIVYGGAIGLGFGMTENFLYFITYSENISGWIYLVIIRSFFSAVMHCVATGILGAFFGFAKFKDVSVKIILILSGLLLAIFIHFIWNYSIITKHYAPLGFVFMGVSIILFCAIFVSSVISERKIIYNELLEESELGNIPTHHTTILSSLKRNNKGWIDESIRKTYIRTATTLAFRKYQIKSLAGRKKILYENDVSEHRELLKKMLFTDEKENE
ncbi:MAG: PrsW family intramembrane metalloprotease [Ignavibacteria bacterium]|nr:PrsW family intramembrane metalloprotease [Ignavibacteria bacterium]MBT8383062.1 PrsW family intramembrane metalloprotease [Ignavibacteria bacterium]MBT8392399.1 PrsW family intramembrane metalloprotease [Ignavibacteria bacterium]NNJ52656.1 PrsW family intramembrane metalloprotease [Ignavibacteriaceae bacterium]NNL22177.1 PrsW family intramembrane metalloprotease [Ignavibacteriaceae bacterium]